MGDVRCDHVWKRVKDFIVKEDEWVIHCEKCETMKKVPAPVLETKKRNVLLG